MGVDLFFVLSGFLVGGILIDQKKTANYFKVFWLRRALRIVPSYALFLVVYGVGMAMPATFWKGSEQWLWKDSLPFWSLATYLQNLVMAWQGRFGPDFTAITWSLAVEEQFYIFFPLMVRWLPSGKILPAALALFLVAPAFRITAGLWLTPEVARQAAIVLLPARCDCLAAGILAAALVRNPSLMARINTSPGGLKWATLAGIGTLAVFPFANLSQTSTTTLDYGFSWIALVGACLVLCLYRGCSPWLCGVFRQPCLRFFGRISYSLYLFHMAFLLIAWALVFQKPPSLDSWREICFAVLVLAAAVGFSQLCWVLFEARCIRFGHRFVYQR